MINFRELGCDRLVSTLLFLTFSLTAEILLAPSETCGRGLQGLASGYVHDRGIERHPAVVFTEDFEEATLQEMALRWNDVVNLEGMSFVDDVPAASNGRQSLLMTSVIGQNTGGHLYRRLAGYDTLFARFYVKFTGSCHPVHHFVHMGGYNPPTDWPQGGAGERPVGDDRFSSGIEPMGPDWRWDFYTYWMHMRGNPVPNMYWGNDFNPTPPVPVARGEWVCVEAMIICNNPVSGFSGEQAFWVNGAEGIHLGQGFPNGYWIWDSFYPHPDSQPFEGFQWRSIEELKINWFWLLFYMTEGTPGQADSVMFDDIVVATDYIGPMNPGIEEMEPRARAPRDGCLLRISPNPAGRSARFEYSTPWPCLVDIALYDAAGRRAASIHEGMEDGGARTKDAALNLPSGIYIAKMAVSGAGSSCPSGYSVCRSVAIVAH